MTREELHNAIIDEALTHMSEKEAHNIVKCHIQKLYDELTDIKVPYIDYLLICTALGTLLNRINKMLDFYKDVEIIGSKNAD